MAVPPLHHGVLHARPDRVALGMPERHRDREVVDDVQDRDDQDEGHEIPVGHVDMRLLAPRERADVEQEIRHPDDDQPQVGIPFGLGVLFRLGHAHEITADRKHAEQVVAEEYEPRADLASQPRPRGSLDDMEGCGNQCIAAEAEDDAGGVGRPHPSEGRPRCVEGEIGPGELGGNPHAHEHAENGPGHRQHDADLDRVVVVAGLPIHLWFRLGKTTKARYTAGRRCISARSRHVSRADQTCRAPPSRYPPSPSTRRITAAYWRSLEVSCVIKSMPPRDSASRSCRRAGGVAVQRRGFKQNYQVSAVRGKVAERVFVIHR